jgi:hypothetical protein
MNASAGDAQVRLGVNDAGELAEMLESLSQWLGSDPALETSFRRWIGHPAYGVARLRQDLDRFTFLLGGHDGEHWLTGGKPGDTQPGNRLTSPGSHGSTGQREARLDTGPSREAISGPQGGADQRSGPPPVKATASHPLSSRALARRRTPAPQGGS